MRISGGAARGIQLAVPKGDAVRPATDGMRQGVFSSLAGLIPGAQFLDLFAGSGAYGLEALSRGAAGGVLELGALYVAIYILPSILLCSHSVGHCHAGTVADTNTVSLDRAPHPDAALTTTAPGVVASACFASAQSISRATPTFIPFATDPKPLRWLAHPPLLGVGLAVAAMR